LKDGSGGDGHFIAAMLAKPSIAAYRPSVGHLAPWADPTAGPAQCRKVFNTGFFAAEAPFQFEYSPGKILVHALKHYILGSVASSKYPY
jgi:hypothetical protein